MESGVDCADYKERSLLVLLLLLPFFFLLLLFRGTGRAAFVSFKLLRAARTRLPFFLFENTEPRRHESDLSEFLFGDFSRGFICRLSGIQNFLCEKFFFKNQNILIKNFTNLSYSSSLGL